MTLHMTCTLALATGYFCSVSIYKLYLETPWRTVCGYAVLCYCHGRWASHERIDVSAVPMAPRVYFQPLSSCIAYPGFSEQCEQRNNWYREQDQQYGCKARAVAMILLYITTLTPSLSHFPSLPSLQYHVCTSTVFYEMSSLSLNWKFYKDRSFFTNLLLLSFQCPLHNCCIVVQIKH